MALLTAARAIPAVAALACTLSACGAPPACVSSGGCPSDQRCQPDGRCAPTPDEARLRGSRWLGAVDWGTVRASTPEEVAPGLDTMELGGPRGAVIHLAFGPLPAGRHIVGARLELHPQEGWSGPPAAGRVLIHRTLPFEGRRLTWRNAPPALGAPVADRQVGAGGPRPLTLDVLDAVVAATRLGSRHMHLRVRRVGSGGGPPWQIASPRATDAARRPRLLLLAR